ncbi:hypothetical protein HRbin28_00511 [bacterium HR28]|nr:hypothetical protein HRbin28_00511 [bacterium HR28]
MTSVESLAGKQRRQHLAESGSLFADFFLWLFQ